MFWSLIQYLKLAIQNLGEEGLKEAKTSGWALENGGWVFQRWCPAQECLVVDTRRRALPQSELLPLIQSIQDHLHRETLSRFHATKKLEEGMEGKTVRLFMDVAFSAPRSCPSSREVRRSRSRVSSSGGSHCNVLLHCSSSWLFPGVIIPATSIPLSEPSSGLSLRQTGITLRLRLVRAVGDSPLLAYRPTAFFAASLPAHISCQVCSCGACFSGVGPGPTRSMTALNLWRLWPRASALRFLKGFGWHAGPRSTGELWHWTRTHSGGVPHP